MPGWILLHSHENLTTAITTNAGVWWFGGVNTVFSVHHPRLVTQHSTHLLLCCLWTICPAYWMSHLSASPECTGAEVCHISMHGSKERHHLTVHLMYRFFSGTEDVSWMKWLGKDACQKWGLTDPLEAATLSFLPGSKHSSSIHYPMSLRCWDKVSFVCLRLLARAHRALKLRLNDGVFISILPFRDYSHPSVLSRWTEPHPRALLMQPPTFLFSLNNNSTRTLLHWH